MIYYLDATGRRDWSLFRSAVDLTSNSYSLTEKDLVFIHLTDFLRALEGQSAFLDERPTAVQDRWRRLVTSVRQTHALGNPATALIFVTGERRRVENHERTVRQNLSKHHPAQVHFACRVERGISSRALERHFGPILDKYAQRCASLEECIRQCEHDFNTLQKYAAFRWLCCAYVYARKQPGFDHGYFDDAYWAPALTGGRLDQAVIDLAQEDTRLRAFRNFLNSEREWTRPSMSDTEIDAQYQLWFEEGFMVEEKQ